MGFGNRGLTSSRSVTKGLSSWAPTTKTGSGLEVELGLESSGFAVLSQF